jgi:CBS domain-containing protein
MRQTIGAVLAAKSVDPRLFTVEAGDTVRDAVEVLFAEGIGAVLIRNEDGLIEGIFTERDLLRRVVHPRLDPDTTPISMAMTRDVRFLSPEDSVEGAMALMHVNRFRHLLVMDGPRVCGLLSIRDMAEHLLRHGEGRFEAAVREAAGEEPAKTEGDL